MKPRPPRSTLFPYTTLFRFSQIKSGKVKVYGVTSRTRVASLPEIPTLAEQGLKGFEVGIWHALYAPKGTPKPADRKSTRLNSSHSSISYAVFCLKKKKHNTGQ